MTDSLPTALRTLRAIVEAEGLRAGLAYLNSRADHRFSALYRFDEETLRNVVFYDRENPGVESTDDIPVMASYCVFVRDQNRTFATHHAALDDRLGDHPKRQVLQAYCGVPLRDAFGRPIGTVCHFDFEPRSVAPEHLDLMEGIAPLLERGLS